MRPMLFVAAAVAVLASPVMAAPAAHPDFTGAWSVAGYSPTLKTEDGKAPPLTPAAQAVYDKNRAMAAKRDRSFDPAARCIPEGMPRLMLINKPFEILQRDKAVYFVHQNRLPHRAYFGEALPTEPEPLYLGYSTARWEGDTLVIETSGFRDVTFLDDSGLPHSDALKLTERYSLGKDGRTFSLRMTIDDPKTFTQSWTAAARFQKRPGFQLPEEVCAEGLETTAPRR
jgi:hypothetical protein